MRKLLVGILLSVAVVGALSAQAISVAAGSSLQGTLERISIVLDNIPIKEAIWTIARRSGVRVAFDGKILPDKRVSYNGTNVTPETAFAAVLAGTGINAERAPNGVFELIQTRAGKTTTNGAITGKVTDSKTSKGIVGARVSIDSDTHGTTTAEDGTYRVAGISTGVHVVTVRLVGYTKQTRSVTVGDGVAVMADFKLESSANVLSEVVVTGTIVATELRAVPNAITVITAKQIEERGITRIDQLFRGDIPGLFSMNSGSRVTLDKVTMFSRGATAIVDPTTGNSVSAGTENGTNPIKTYVDGVELADPRYLSQIDPSSVERIEILTGPQASTIYGANAINGVMQIFTKRGSSSIPRFALNLSSGVAQNNFSKHLAPSHVTDVSVSGVEGRVSYNVGGSWNYTGTWTPANQTQRLSGNGGSRIDFAKSSVDVTARQGLTKTKRNGSTTQGTVDLRSMGVYSPTATSDLPVPQLSTLKGTTVGFSLSHRLFSWWSHNIGVGSDDSNIEIITTSPTYGGTTGSDTTLFINNLGTYRLSERYATTIQVSLTSFAGLNLTVGGDHWRTKGSSWTANPIVLTGSIPSPTVTRTHPGSNSGAFVQGQFSIKDALFFTYGIRSDWNPNFGDRAKVKPGRYGVSYARDINTPFGSVSAKLRGSYGRSIRPPSEGLELAVPVVSGTFYTLFGPHDSRLANPDLGPEHQQGGEGGMELYFGSRASLVITRYNQTVDNLIAQAGRIAGAGLSKPGPDSVRSLAPLNNINNCSSSFRDDEGHCYRYQTQYLNVGSIRNQGWELQSSVNIGPLTTRGTYSWTKSRVLGVTPKYKALLAATNPEFEAGGLFNYLPEHTWALGMVYAHSQGSLALSVNGIGIRYVNDNGLSQSISGLNRLSSNRPRFDISNYRALGTGYSTADLNATQRLSPRIDATLQITNLTDYYQNDFSVQNVSIGRQTRAGVRVRW